MGTNKRRNLISTKDRKHRSYLGVSEKEAKYFLNLAYYEEDFFLYEPTPFFTYYINHLDNVLSESYDKQISKDSKEIIEKSKFLC